MRLGGKSELGRRGREKEVEGVEGDRDRWPGGLGGLQEAWTRSQSE